jgi:hypothetical protein
LLDIAERADVPFTEVAGVAQVLEGHELLEVVQEG